MILMTMFLVFLIGIVCRLAFLSIQFAWGTAKVIFSLVIFPVFLVGLLLSGLVYLAFPILMVAGLLAIVRS